jgi:O-antigen ligase
MGGALALFDKRWRWVWLGLAGVQGVALLLTFSKGALLLGIPAGVAVLALGGWWMKRRRGESGRRLIWLGLAVLVAVAALAPFLGTERFQRILDVSQGSTAFFRLQLWRSAWQMILDHPLWGVGPDNFLYAFRSGYILPTAWQEPNLNHPHNMILDLWTRLGLPGLLVAGVWLGVTVRSLVRQIRHSHDEQFILALGMLATVAAALAHGLIDVSYALPDLMMVWVLCSMHDVSQNQ